jgi:hypothetical protein
MCSEISLEKLHFCCGVSQLFDAFLTLKLLMAGDKISLPLPQGGSFCDASFDRHRVTSLILPGRVL